MPLIADDGKRRIERLAVSPYNANAYLVICAETRESVLIDAPGRADLLLARLEGTRPKSLLITHEHFDHTGALPALRSKLGVPVAAHAADADGLPVKPDILLGHEDRVTVGNLELNVIHTPGHTPGSLCFHLPPQLHLFAGDTLFPGGPGRTGCPADFRAVVASIRDRLLSLPDETAVHPGHGDPTTIGACRAEFEDFASRAHPPELHGEVRWRES